MGTFSLLDRNAAFVGVIEVSVPEEERLG